MDAYSVLLSLGRSGGAREAGETEERKKLQRPVSAEGRRGTLKLYVLAFSAEIQDWDAEGANLDFTV